ncbi:hypothetical protein MN202_02020 [Rheinheimera muenzenbergensis]|uniref:Uncharacterized protein n=1 Tax=Rheinheimera muenzenbergensis TaxID=1193628 RepID=A0ABU8C2W8_9GAMM
MSKLSTKVFLIFLVSLVYVITGSVVAGWLGILPLVIAVCFPQMFKVTLLFYIALAASNVFLMLYVGAKNSFLDGFLHTIGLPYGSNELALFYAARTWGFGVAGFMTFIGYHNYKTVMMETRESIKVES